MGAGSPVELRFHLFLRTRTGVTDYKWFGGQAEEWWKQGWGSPHLRQNAPSLLIDVQRNRLYLGAIRSSRTDAVAGSLITYDLALLADPHGRVSQEEVQGLVHEWWAQRLEPGVWPLGRALDARLDLSEATDELGFEGLVLSLSHLPLRDVDSPVDGRQDWVGSGNAVVPSLLSAGVAGTGPPVAYFQTMTPGLASETFLDSGALLIVEGDAEVHRKKAPAPLPEPRPAAVSRGLPMVLLILLMVGLILAALLLAII